jgi:hypothetical protein
MVLGMQHVMIVLLAVVISACNPVTVVVAELADRQQQEARTLQSTTEACTLCNDGNPPMRPQQDLTSTLEEQGYTELLASVGITKVSCGMVPGLLPLIPGGGLNSTQCESLQQVGVTVCGCLAAENGTAVPSKSPSFACRLCPAGGDPATGDVDVSDLLVDIDATCDDVTKMVVNVADDQCTVVQRSVAKRCSCEEQPTTTNSAVSNHSQPAETTHPNQCTLCWDGSVPTLYDKDMTKILTESKYTHGYVAALNLTNVTCGQLNVIMTLANLNISTDPCYFVQTGLGGICGCPPVPNNCVFCPHDSVIPFPNKLFLYSRYNFQTLLTCKEVDGVITQLGNDEDICWRVHQTSFACGCNGGEKQYLGTKTHGQKAALAWLPRISGTLSLLGSLYIVVDVVKRYAKKKKLPRNTGTVQSRPVYDSIVGIMASCDAMFSVCWILSTAPAYKSEVHGGPSGIYGAFGTQESCRLQGFFVQLSGIASLFYNVVLAFYYLLVIVYSVREERIKKYSFFLLTPPIILAVVLAVKGWRFYTSAYLICTIPPPPQAQRWRETIRLTIVPISFCLIVATVLTAVIYLSVRKNLYASMQYEFTRSTSFRSSSELYPEAASSRSLRAITDSIHPATGTGTQSFWVVRWLKKLRKRQVNPVRHRTTQDKALLHVFCQCCFYLAAFLIAYPVWLVGNIQARNASYSLWIAVVLLTPLQGFLNFLVYIRSTGSPSGRPQRRRSPTKRKTIRATGLEAAHPVRGREELLEINVNSPVSAKPMYSVTFQDPSGGEEHSSTRDETSFSLDTSLSRGNILQQDVAIFEAMATAGPSEEKDPIDDGTDRLEL